MTIGGASRPTLLPRRRRAAAILGVVGAFAIVGGAFGYWMTTGAGRAVVGTATLGPATAVTASGVGQTRNVSVSWTAAVPPVGATLTGSYVLRYSGTTPSAACGSSSGALLAATATSCTDSSVPAGAYTYAVVAVFRSWTAASAASGTVTVAASSLASFSVAPSTTTPTAGASFTATLTAIDQYGATYASYTGAKCISFANPHASPNGTNPTYPTQGSCPSGSAVTFTNGVASPAIALVDAETTTLKASDVSGGTTGTSASLTVAPAAASRLAFSQQPSASATAGTVFATQPKVAVTDTYGNVVTTSVAPVTLAVTGAGATIACTTNPLAATGGLASFAACAMTKAGTWALTASSGTLTAATSATLTVAAAAASILAVSSGSGQAATVGTAFANQLVALATDAYANPVAGVSVTFSAPVTGAAASFAGAASLIATTGATGLASSGTVTAGTVSGAYSVTATGTGTTSATFSLTNNVGPAAALAFSQQPSSSATAGIAFSTQPKVSVTDTYGNVVTTSTASVTLAVTGGGATIACTTNPLASLAGVASFAACTMTKAGTWTLTASSGTLTAATSASLTVAAASASALAVSSGSGQAATVGSRFASSLAVTVTDVYGNAVTGTSVTFTTPSTGPSATFPNGNGSATVSTSSGTASTPPLTANTVAGTFTVTAASAGLTSVSFSLANTPAAAALLTFVQQPAGATAGFAFGTQPIVAVTDAYGNLVTTSALSVTLAITTGTGTAGATLTCTTNPVAASSGDAAFAGCAVGSAGSGYTLTASASGVTSAASASFSVATALTASGVSLLNKSGGTAGKTEVGDSIVVTLSGTLDASTLCSAWTSDTTAYSLSDGTVTIKDNKAPSGNDEILVTTTSSCGGSLNFGYVDMGSKNYKTGADVVYAASIAWDPTAGTLTILFTSNTNGSVTNSNSYTAKYYPSSTMTDPAGHAIGGTPAYSGVAF